MRGANDHDNYILIDLDCQTGSFHLVDSNGSETDYVDDLSSEGFPLAAWHFRNHCNRPVEIRVDFSRYAADCPLSVLSPPGSSCVSGWRQLDATSAGLSDEGVISALVPPVSDYEEYDYVLALRDPPGSGSVVALDPQLQIEPPPTILPVGVLLVLAGIAIGVLITYFGLRRRRTAAS